MRLIFLTIMAIQAASANGASAQPPATTNVAPQATSSTKRAGEAPNSTGTAVKAFQERLKEYVAFRNKVEATVPPLTETSDPAKISARERALGEALIKARGNARPAEYFIKDVQPIVRQIIKADFAKRTPAERKALTVELPKDIKVAVNSLYPTTIPLVTFPPNLLKALPDLPPELEYRIVNRDLILRDVEGNYVVDVMLDAFPIAK
jgi:hypothetical protein